MAFEGLDMPESPAALPSDDEGMSIANLMGVQARTTGPSTTKWDKIYSQCVSAKPRDHYVRVFFSGLPS